MVQMVVMVIYALSLTLSLGTAKNETSTAAHAMSMVTEGIQSKGEGGRVTYFKKIIGPRGKGCQ